jgi:hypothetical protein
VCVRWSADGTRLAYLEGGGVARELDGSTLYATAGGAVVVRGLDGSTPAPAAGDPAPADLANPPDGRANLLSPSGKWVASVRSTEMPASSSSQGRMAPTSTPSRSAIAPTRSPPAHPIGESGGVVDDDLEVVVSERPSRAPCLAGTAQHAVAATIGNPAGLLVILVDIGPVGGRQSRVPGPNRARTAMEPPSRGLQTRRAGRRLRLAVKERREVRPRSVHRVSAQTQWTGGTPIGCGGRRAPAVRGPQRSCAPKAPHLPTSSGRWCEYASRRPGARRSHPSL